MDTEVSSCGRRNRGQLSYSSGGEPEIGKIKSGVSRHPKIHNEYSYGGLCEWLGPELEGLVRRNRVDVPGGQAGHATIFWIQHLQLATAEAEERARVQDSHPYRVRHPYRRVKPWH